jgi:glycosyltransferase involved in cell wall biosynthesis
MFAAQSPLQNHRKGKDLLLAALAELNGSRKIGLMSVGQSQPHAAVPSGYSFSLGELNSERLMSFAYSAADLFILPTREDNLPNVVLEAMACGIPVVAFDVGGLPDMVRPDVTGLLVPSEDVGGLRSAIEAILGDGERRARMSLECRRVAVEQYSLEIQAGRYRRLYEELLATQRRAAHGAIGHKPLSDIGNALSDAR